MPPTPPVSSCPDNSKMVILRERSQQTILPNVQCRPTSTSNPNTRICQRRGKSFHAQSKEIHLRGIMASRKGQETTQTSGKGKHGRRFQEYPP